MDGHGCVGRVTPLDWQRTVNLGVHAVPNNIRRLIRTTEHLTHREGWQDSLFPDPDVPPAPSVPQGKDWASVARRWETTKASPDMRRLLLSDEAMSGAMGDPPPLIENFIGAVQVPVGLAGPLRVNGSHARGDFYIPMATLEPTLIATYSRGAQTISLAGGCTAVLLDEGVIRSPGYEFESLVDSVEFAHWIAAHEEEIRGVAEGTTRFGKILDLKARVTGRYVHLIFEMATGDAMGQNMVTIAVDAVMKHLAQHCPIKPVFATLDANMSGDKKPSVQTFQSVRGRNVSAEVVIPRDLCLERLNVEPERMKSYNDIAWTGGVNSGTVGIQGHYANGLTALYIACGQDAACASESAVGVTMLDVTEDGDLYASVTLPNIMVGTVGVVSYLPGQRACLELLGLYGKGAAAKLAEVCAGVALAGDLSMLAALSAGEFARAHRRLGRGKYTSQNIQAVKAAG
jgi:hydroxymethylglutaryl-CoA reductase (NADPH)